METLIFNGSPRKSGDIAFLVEQLKTFLTGDVRVIDAYSCRISPCVDCRRCWTAPGCSLRDGWEEVDGLLRRCGSVVIASPIYFSELTGPLLSVLSRLQQYYCAKYFRHEETGLSPKRGGLLLTGGGDGSPDPAVSTAEGLLRHMGCRETAPPVCCLRTNRVPAREEPGIRDRLRDLADFLEGRR